jgi:ABC-2 type transport system permease protein
MVAIIKKEITAFFSSTIGYLVIGLFLVINGLFLWVFPGEYNIFDSGFADLAPFFELAPWIFLFLIPAVTMRAFSEELRLGTLELLFTKPLSLFDLVLGKYLASLVLLVIALVPTMLYIYTISALGNPTGNLDSGSTVGSYIGLLLLAAAYTAIGIFASTLSENQIVAFLTAVLLSFFLYYGFEGIAELGTPGWIEQLGMRHHYNSVACGVLDTRDVVYFVSVAGVFLSATVFKLQRQRQ